MFIPQMKTGFEDIPLVASLVYENSSEAGSLLPPQDILVLDSPTVIVNGRVIAKSDDSNFICLPKDTHTKNIFSTNRISFQIEFA